MSNNLKQSLKKCTESDNKSIDLNNDKELKNKKNRKDSSIISNEKQLKDTIKKNGLILNNDSNTKINSPLGLSMSGCGFLGSYHFGAVICIKKNSSNLFSKFTHFGGASIGSIVAALLILAPNHLEDALSDMYKLADEINSYSLGVMTRGFSLSERLFILINKYIPENVFIANNKLIISVTRQSYYTNRLISTYPSRKYLLNALAASCYIPIYSGYIGNAPQIDDKKYIDGGYSNNLPLFENVPTITISPFSGSAIISPTDRNIFDWNMKLSNQLLKVNLQNIVRGAQALFPPSSTVLKTYFNLGYRDAMLFLIENDLFERNPLNETEI